MRGVRLEERLGVGVAGDELDAHHLGPDHPVDGVAAATPTPMTRISAKFSESERNAMGFSSGDPRRVLGGVIGWLWMSLARALGATRASA
jgi:hypothetical protein